MTTNKLSLLTKTRNVSPSVTELLKDVNLIKQLTPDTRVSLVGRIDILGSSKRNAKGKLKFVPGVLIDEKADAIRLLCFHQPYFSKLKEAMDGRTAILLSNARCKRDSYSDELVVFVNKSTTILDSEKQFADARYFTDIPILSCSQLQDKTNHDLFVNLLDVECKKVKSQKVEFVMKRSEGVLQVFTMKCVGVPDSELIVHQYGEEPMLEVGSAYALWYVNLDCEGGEAILKFKPFTRFEMK